MLSETESSGDLYERLRALIRSLGAGFIEREEAVRLALLAALSGEHLLLIGPPGTAKSELARRLHQVFAEANYFERLVTRFTVPEELFGPLSIAGLEEDRFERKTAGFLPEASVAFLDEVFNANSAILNALLALLNERVFDNGTRRERVPLITLIAASNAVPKDEVLAAFHDRFLLRCAAQPVSDEAFMALLGLPDLRDSAPPIAARLTRDDLAWVARQRARVVVPAEVLEMLAELRAWAHARDWFVSDRRWRRLVDLMRTGAAVQGRDSVNLWDLWLAQFVVAPQPDDAEEVERWYAERLGMWAPLPLAVFERAVHAFETQLETELSAPPLVLGESGKSAFSESMHEAGAQGGAQRLDRLGQAAGRRRYGPAHVAARVGQIDELDTAANAYLETLNARIAQVEHDAPAELWITPRFIHRARNALGSTRSKVVELRQRLLAARQGFAVLPLDEALAEVPVPLSFD